MKATPISKARQIGQETGATRVAVLVIDDDGRYAVTTWGKTKSQCDAMRRWSETCGASVLAEIFETG